MEEKFVCEGLNASPIPIDTSAAFRVSSALVLMVNLGRVSSTWVLVKLPVHLFQFAGESSLMMPASPAEPGARPESS